MSSVLDSSEKPAMERTTSAPQASSAANGLSGNADVYPSLSSTLSSPGGTVGKAKGMQLGAHKSPANEGLSKMAAEWAEEVEAEAETSRSHPWAGEDLMDVNADQDDWSAFPFESCQVLV